MKRRPSGSRNFDLGAVPHEVFSVSLCGVTDEMAAHTVPVALCGRGAVIAEDYGLFDVVFEVGGDIVGDDKYACAKKYEDGGGNEVCDLIHDSAPVTLFE